MVIYYDLNTNDILYTENSTLIPTLPAGTTEEKKQILERENVRFVSVNYEMDLEIFNYKVCFDLNNNFIGLQPK